MLPIYEQSEHVAEIIIINNAPKPKEFEGYKKIKEIGNGKNIFVNPAWNLGASLAENKILLLNDDLTILNVDEICELLEKTDFDIVGLNLRKDDNLRITEVTNFPNNSYGTFMFIKDYIYIPDNLLIWYGDKILFDHAHKRGILRGAKVITDKSETINSDRAYFRDQIGGNDVINYDKMTANNGKLNILIRTSGRPIYFFKCIKSIKKTGVNCKLHIISDSETDLKYIESNCLGMDYAVYQVDKSIISDICKKIPIIRAPFVFNYYYNVVKPLVKGWCMLLDDDDELYINPNFEKNENNFYLYSVKCGERIIPSVKNKGKIVLNDISGIGVIFHSSQMPDFIPQRGGDFDFIKKLSQKYPYIFMDEILSGTAKGNKGQKNDIKDKKISVNMATYPERYTFAKKVIRNLLEIDFIDTIRIYLNEYDKIPESLPKDNRIIYKLGKNLKDSGKFFWAIDFKDEYYFTIDDDLIYSKEYFINHLETLQRYDNQIFVTSHGKVMKEKPEAFNDCISNFHCLKSVSSDEWVNNPGTGVMAFDNSKFAVSVNMFEFHGMADLWMAYYLQKNEIPCLCRKHESKELIYILPEQADTLFEQRSEMHPEHMKIIKKIKKFILYTYG